MSDYSKTFTKTTGDVIAASDFDTEFDAISTAIATKQDSGTKTLLNEKLLNIGDWNMDTTQSVSVAHGLTFSKIRAVRAMILSDSGATLTDINWGYPAAITSQAGISVDTVNVNLYRDDANLLFNSTSYDSTGFNRGYITIWYTD